MVGLRKDPTNVRCHKSTLWLAFRAPYALKITTLTRNTELCSEFREHRFISLIYRKVYSTESNTKKETCELKAGISTQVGIILKSYLKTLLMLGSVGSLPYLLTCTCVGIHPGWVEQASPTALTTSRTEALRA